MPWIARDATGSNPCRIFGERPMKLQMVSYDGNLVPYEFTWSGPASSGRHMGGGHDGETFAALTNTEPTVLPPGASPLALEPGEGPVEVRLVLAQAVAARPWEGEGI